NMVSHVKMNAPAAAANDQVPAQNVNIEPSRLQRRNLHVIQSQPCFKNTHFLTIGVHVRVPETQSQPVKTVTLSDLHIMNVLTLDIKTQRYNMKP
ncbi:hypothetical protein RJ640_008939, partial [Escallonia rubra]